VAGKGFHLERGLDGGGDEPRGFRVDDDVPAEQDAADDLPGMQERIVRANGGGLGRTRTVELRSWSGVVVGAFGKNSGTGAEPAGRDAGQGHLLGGGVVHLGGLGRGGQGRQSRMVPGVVA